MSKYPANSINLSSKLPRFKDGLKVRQCKRFYCVMAGERRCCAECPRKKSEQCSGPCLNSPERCGLSEEK